MSLGYTLDTQIGRVAAGEWDTIRLPRTILPRACGIVLCHGHGTPQQWIGTAGSIKGCALADGLAAAGFPSIAGDFGGDTWGNSTAMTRVDTAAAALQAAVPGLRTDKIILIGVSMGGAVASIWAQANPRKVAAFVGIIPLLDLNAMYVANTGGYQAEIAAAWGVATGDPLPTAADNAAGVTKQRHVPTLLAYSSVDPLITPLWVTTYADALDDGTALMVDAAHTGHTDATIGELPIPTVGQFLAAHL